MDTEILYDADCSRKVRPFLSNSTTKGVLVMVKGRGKVHTLDMSAVTNRRVILAQMLLGSTRSPSGVEEPGQLYEKWANGTNVGSMECYNAINPSQRGHLQQM